MTIRSSYSIRKGDDGTTLFMRYIFFSLLFLVYELSKSFMRVVPTCSGKSRENSLYIQSFSSLHTLTLYRRQIISCVIFLQYLCTSTISYVYPVGA